MIINVLVNPAAGRGRSLRLLPKVKSWLPRGIHDFKFIMTESRLDLIDKTRAASVGNVDAILSLGGDGTAHDISQAMAADGPALGVLPCGRGNDFARNMGYPTGLRAICKGFARPSFKEIDLPTVNNIPFLSIAGVGFDSLVSRLTRDGRCRIGGTACYVWYLLKALFLFHPVDLQLDLDGKPEQGDYMMAAAANAPCYGGGMRMAPEARPDDGLLDVVLIDRMAIPGLLRRFPKVYAGKHVQLDQVRVTRARRITLTSGRELEIYADGEFMAKLPATIEVGTKRMKVIVPGSV